jgi:hypothetical protein
MTGTTATSTSVKRRPDGGSHERRHRPGARILLWTSLALVVMAAAACSSNSSTTTQSSPTIPAAGSPSAAASSPGGSASPLTGRWTGQYSGTFNGTFNLTWRQSSSTLTGVIHLNPGGISHINGTVSGGSIRFGTVGSTAITYTGSVSGNSMSGTWKVHAGPGGNGTWSATKSS